MKFCFKGNITGALLGKTGGGGELQVALLAKSLALHGHEVIIIDPKDCDEDFVTPEGIKVYTIPDWKKGFPVFRFVFKLLPKYYRFLIDQKADVYYCRIRDFQHLLMYIASRKVKARFVMAMAADIDATGFKERYRYFYKVQKFSLWLVVSGFLIELIQPFLLRRADYILTQHETQKKILDDRNIQSFVFRNLIDLSKLPIVQDPVQTDFIYVSNWLNKRKGFRELYSLIENCPAQTFTIVGEPADAVSEDLYQRLKNFSNVTLTGKLKHKDALMQIANAKALVTTSPMEGFPNIFIEAWALGVPVISWMVDPGNIIVNNQLGLVCDGDFNRLITYIQEFDSYSMDRNALKNYVIDNHSFELAYAKFMDIINS